MIKTPFTASQFTGFSNITESRSLSLSVSAAGTILSITPSIEKSTTRIRIASLSIDGASVITADYTVYDSNDTDFISAATALSVPMRFESSFNISFSTTGTATPMTMYSLD